MLLTKTFQKGQPVPWRFKPGSTATITWIEVVSKPHVEKSQILAEGVLRGRHVNVHDDCVASCCVAVCLTAGFFVVCHSAQEFCTFRIV